VSIGRKESTAVTVGVLLVTAAFVVPHLHLGIVTPLINSTAAQIRDYAQTAPIFGWWNAHVGWGTVPALAIAVAAVLWGPSVAARLPWRAVPWTAWAVSCGWAFALAMVDGWQRGFAGRLTAPNEYLRQIPTVTDIPEALRTFSSRIPDFQPNSWITHVSGHPPGALLTFVWLDRIGLGGGAWAAVWCVLIGSSAAAAIVLTLRTLCGEGTARSAAPFVAVAPTAIWIAVSADGYYAGVAAWGIALLALATRNRHPVLTGAGAGLLLGWGIFLNYGLGLMMLPAVAVLITAADWRTAARVLVPAVVAALVVVGVFAAAGFWWFDGYTLVQHRYWQGIAHNRPFQYWSWANLASVVCAIGLGSAAGIGRAFDLAALRRRDGLHLLVLAALLAIVCADLSMLSKAETERIWLPFTVWLTAACALLPPQSRRWWLALNVIGALALNHLILTNW
jgi:methylthioxylose transferase